jgi:O-antigen biosynthesis protein
LANMLTALGANRNTKILDVGGKKGLLRSFPGFSPTIIDIEESDEPNFIQGDALNMPFNDSKFAYVVSCDVLEHIPKKDREKFILEMLRVSDKGVVICAPFDNPGNGALEQKMNDYYAHLTGQQHRWLREHIDNGLPSEKEVESTVKKHGYKYAKFRHFSPQVWQAIVSQHLLHAAFGDNKQLEDMIHKMYRHYYDKLCNMDFASDGYRTFFWISKTETPEVVLPSEINVQEARNNFFAANSSLMLEFMEHSLQEQRDAAQIIAQAQAQEQALVQSNKELEQIRSELNAIKSHKAWQVLHRIRVIVNPDKPTGNKKGV